MPQGTKISFVTWPTGEVDQESLTIAGEGQAKAGFIAHFFPHRLFGDVGPAAIDALWRAARDHGFKVHTVSIAKGGEPTLERP
jgi:hypothetical protein